MPQFRRFQNFPNPFNGRTFIAYHISTAGYVELTIFAPNGQLVRRLLGADMPNGNYSTRWDGRDEDGLQTACGFYLCQLKIDSLPIAFLRILIMR